MPSRPRLNPELGSIPCPKCGGRMTVKDTRPCPSGIRRRRMCISGCGRFTTFEIFSEAPPPQGLTNALQLAADALHASLERVNTAIAAERMLRELNNG